MKSDIEIAREAKLRPITAVADSIGVPEAALHPYGRHIAKIDLGFIDVHRRFAAATLVHALITNKKARA